MMKIEVETILIFRVYVIFNECWVITGYIVDEAIHYVIVGNKLYHSYNFYFLFKYSSMPSSLCLKLIVNEP
jgi:hypothetical protein